MSKRIISTLNTFEGALLACLCLRPQATKRLTNFSEKTFSSESSIQTAESHLD